VAIPEAVVCRKDEDGMKIRPIGDHSQPSCITVQHTGRSIPALFDTGSDVSIAGSNIAKQHRWKIRSAELKSVNTANGEHTLTEGLVAENLSAGKEAYSVRHLHLPKSVRLNTWNRLDEEAGPNVVGL